MLSSRRLGKTSLELPHLCFGTWAIGGSDWGTVDEASERRALEAALDIGMVAIDTAPAYGEGLSERYVGEVIRGRREEVLLMTKVGLRWAGDGGSALGSKRKRGDFYRDCRPESLKWGVEQSLARMNVERIDLLQIHWPDPETPIDETMGSLAELRQAGKIREIGVSNYSLEKLREIHRCLGDTPLASIQVPYNPLNMQIDDDLLPWAIEHDVGVLAYSPLMHGLLTGKVHSSRRFPDNDHRSRHPFFSKRSRNLVNTVLAETVSPIARGHDATVAQTILSWVISRKGISAALVGMRSEEQVHENMRSVKRLPADQVEEIEEAFSRIELGTPLISRWLNALRWRT